MLHKSLASVFPSFQRSWLSSRATKVERASLPPRRILPTPAPRGIILMEREAKFLDRSFAVLSRWTRALKTLADRAHQIRRPRFRSNPIRRNFTGRPPEHGHLRALQPLLAVEFLVAIDGGVVSPVKAVSHEGGGRRPAFTGLATPPILSHQSRRLAT